MIGGRAFSNARNLKWFEFLPSIAQIETQAFFNTNLTNRDFRNCTGLNSLSVSAFNQAFGENANNQYPDYSLGGTLYIPGNVTSLSQLAFAYNDPQITHIQLGTADNPSQLISVGVNSFVPNSANTKYTITAYIPASSQGNPVWDIVANQAGEWHQEIV